MRIVQINGTFGHGDSTGGTTKEMHDWFIKNGHESYVLVNRIINPNEADDHIQLFSTVFGNKSHALLSRLTGLQGYFSFYDTYNLINKLKSLNPDVVVLRVLHNNSVNLGMILRNLKENRVATIVVLHDCWLYTGHCCHYVQHGCTKWQSGCKSCEYMHEWNNSWLFNTSAKCYRDKKKWFREIPALAVIGVSDWVTSDAGRSLLKSANIKKRIYNWVDIDSFRPKETKSVIRKKHKIKGETKMLFAVSTFWAPNKGMKEILRVANQLQNIALILAGDAGEDIIENPNIVWLGRIQDRNTLADYYSAADYVLNPSIHETFGKTTAEALSCGTPVIAYRTTGSIELIGGSRGHLAECGNIDDYINVVEAALKHEKKEYSVQCREFAEQNFSIEKNINDYVEVFHELKEVQQEW